eukprot:6067235-Pleurochrysis_carterae.AAC.3
MSKAWTLYAHALYPLCAVHGVVNYKIFTQEVQRRPFRCWEPYAWWHFIGIFARFAIGSSVPYRDKDNA